MYSGTLSYGHPVKVTLTFVGVPQRKICTSTVFTVFPIKPWTLEKISGMCIVSQPIRCEMKLHKIIDKPQLGSVTTWYETMSWFFLQQDIFNFPFGCLWKSYFLTTNQDQSLDSLCSKTKLPNRPKSECKLWKITTVQVGVMGEGFSATKKYRSKTTNHN